MTFHVYFKILDVSTLCNYLRDLIGLQLLKLLDLFSPLASFFETVLRGTGLTCNHMWAVTSIAVFMLILLFLLTCMLQSWGHSSLNFVHMHDHRNAKKVVFQDECTSRESLLGVKKYLFSRKSVVFHFFTSNSYLLRGYF